MKAPVAERGGLDVVKLTQNFVRFPVDTTEGVSGLVSYQEQLVSEYLPHTFETKRLKTRKPGEETLIIGNHELPDLIIVGHNDGVAAWTHQKGAQFGKGKYPPHKGLIVFEDGHEMVVGRGSLDNVSAAATFLDAVSRYKGKEDQLPRVAGAFTVDEEGHFAGMDALADYYQTLADKNPGWQPVFIMSLNGNDRNISTMCRGVGEFRFTVDGLEGHAAIRKPGDVIPVNAIRQGVSMIDALEDAFKAGEPTDLGRSTLNLASFEGGKKRPNGKLKGVANIVPGRARGLLEVRFAGGNFSDGQPISPDSIIAKMHDLAAGHEVTLIRAKSTMYKPEWLSNPRGADFLEDLHIEVTGDTHVERWVPQEHGYDEVAILASRLRINGRTPDAAIWGLVSSRGFHKADEGASTKDLRDQATVLTEVLKQPQFQRRTHITG